MFKLTAISKSAAILCLMLVHATLALYSESTGAMSEPAGDGLVLITHSSNDQNEIYLRTLRGIYSMRMQAWPDGSSLTVYVLGDDNDLHRSFCQTVLGVLPFHLRRNWDRLIFSGCGQAPTVVNNMQEMKVKVAATPGAIGYLSKGYIDDSIAVINVKN